MKLFEIAIRPETTELSKYNYIDKLCQFMPMLSSGSYAEVYSERGSNIVTKVVSLKTPPQDDPYLAYIKICMKLRSNPFLPKFYSVRAYHCPKEGGKQGSEYYGVVTMEKLIKYDDLPSNVEISAGDFFDQYKEMRNAVIWNEHPSDIKYELPPDVQQPRVQQIKRHGGSYVNMYNALIRATKNVHLATALKIVRNLLIKKQSAAEDMHTGNIMWRHEGGNEYQLVIVDPVAQF